MSMLHRLQRIRCLTGVDEACSAAIGMLQLVTCQQPCHGYAYTHQELFTVLAVYVLCISWAIAENLASVKGDKNAYVRSVPGTFCILSYTLMLAAVSP